MRVVITIPGVPIPEPRKRVAVRAIRGKMIAQVYTPKTAKVVPFKMIAASCAKVTMKRMSPLEGPLKMTVVFVMPRVLTEVWKTKPMPRLPHAKKPDIDNLQKSLFDALTGIVWYDDAQICTLVCEKWIAAGDEQPRVVLIVDQML